MPNSIRRFLGGSPLKVLLKLIVASFIVGFVMSIFGWHPRDIYAGLARMMSNLWERGFQIIADSADYLLLGAAIVVPLFLIIRLFSYRSGGRGGRGE